MVISYHLKENISSARKVFRLFRFFDEIKGLAKIVRSNKPIAYKILSVFTYLCSCFYYLTDNALWTIGILITSGVIDKSIKKVLTNLTQVWKRKKNTFSLMRVIAYLIILLYSVILQNRQNKQYLEEMLHKSDDDSDSGSSTLKFGKKFI